MNTRLRPTITRATTGLLAAGLALAPPPANAGDLTTRAHTPAHTPAHIVARHPAPEGAQALSASKLAAVRALQRGLLAQRAPAPTLAGAATRAASKVQRLTVTTTEDSGLADPNGTRCLDAATGACSLRAAVDAANNRLTPVRIVLGKHTYVLSTAAPLTVTNPAGTSIVGAGADRTTITGTPDSQVLDERQSDLGSNPQAPLAYLTDVTVTGGTSSGSGGGIFLDGSETGATLVLDGVDVTGNTAAGYGGAVATIHATLYARDSSFSDNAAQHGGALDTEYSNVDLTDVSLTGNQAPSGGEGGAWWNQYSVVRMQGGTLSHNTAGDPSSGGWGGGLFDEYGNVALADVHVDHNSAVGQGHGGGIYTFFSLFEVAGGTMSHNHADAGPTARGQGGAIDVDQGAQVDLHGVTLRGDTVDGDTTSGSGGGALYLFGGNAGTQLTVDRGSRIAGANNSAVYAEAFDGIVDIEINGARLSANRDDATNGFNGLGCGGAVCVFAHSSGSVNLTMNKDTLEENTSAGHYGSGGVTVWTTQSSAARVHLLRSTFRDNTTGAGGHGGALGVYGSNDSTPMAVRTESDTFVGNQAGSADDPGRGGAIGVEGYTTFHDTGSVFSKNHARGDGAYAGAVYSNGQENSRFTGSRFTHNSSGPPDGGSGHGGAVFVDDEGGTAFTRVSVDHNRSASEGGGIDISSLGYTVTVEDSTIAANTAGAATGEPGIGGGIYSYNAVLVLENTTVADNRALAGSSGETAGVGGGIYADTGSVVGMRYSTVTGNAAPEGGGLFLAGLSGSALGSIVSANHSVAGGEDDCSSLPESTPHSLGGNVLGQRRCVTATSPQDKVTRHPRLRKLADNGGPTQTEALKASSPAVGRGTFACPSADQRGHDRPAHHCDAGAFELPKVKKHHHH